MKNLSNIYFSTHTVKSHSHQYPCDKFSLKIQGKKHFCSQTTMDIESDTFTVKMPQKMQLDDYAIDYPFTVASNNSSSDFVQVMMNYCRAASFQYIRCICKIKRRMRRFSLVESVSWHYREFS